MKKTSDFSVQDWLTYLEYRHLKEIQLGLSRVRALAKQANLLAFNAPVITVAGTNGKGSTIASLEAIYAAAGYHVAAYTSPHLLCFNERIRMHQKPITDEMLCAAFLAIDALSQSEQLTYFEMTTLAAFWYFRQCKPDVILLEVGMGGRLDATNCIDADLAIITSIDLDHEAFLGTTRDQIAFEKSGIFRPKQLAVCAEENPPTRLLAQIKKYELNAAILQKDYDFEVTQDDFQFFIPDQIQLQLPRPKLNVKAFAAAMMACLKLQSVLPIEQQHFKQAAETVSILGRQQWLDTAIPTLVDVAHNPHAVKLLAAFVKNSSFSGQIHVVFSALKDKKLYDLMLPMRAYVNKWYLTTLNHSRSASDDLLQMAYTRIMNQPSETIFDDPVKAYTAAADAVKPGDIIIVYGSFLLISAVMLSPPIQRGIQ